MTYVYDRRKIKDFKIQDWLGDLDWMNRIDFWGRRKPYRPAAGARTGKTDPSRVPKSITLENHDGLVRLFGGVKAGWIWEAIEEEA